MNIDFIKWMVEKAEGFEWERLEGLGLMCSYGPWSAKFSCLSERIYYPLLLQRAIEGWNNGLTKIIIIQSECGCFIFGQEEIDFSADTYDGSKEKALMYIYEQEKDS